MKQSSWKMSNKNPYNQYSNTQNAATDPRQTEARALLEAARRISVAKDAEDSKALDEALKLNSRLWTIFQADIAREENPLPDDIKSSIINLSLFIDKKTFEFLAYNDGIPTGLDTLININRNIAAGLLESIQNAKKKATETAEKSLQTSEV